MERESGVRSKTKKKKKQRRENEEQNMKKSHIEGKKKKVNPIFFLH